MGCSAGFTESLGPIPSVSLTPYPGLHTQGYFIFKVAGAPDITFQATGRKTVGRRACCFLFFFLILIFIYLFFNFSFIHMCIHVWVISPPFPPSPTSPPLPPHYLAETILPLSLILL
jgi:hypothetical protein